MRTGLTKKLREALRAAPAGMTTAKLREHCPGAYRSSIEHCLKNSMPDAYILRWETEGNLAAVWAVVVPPQDAPRPEPKYPNQGLRKRALAVAKITPP